MRTLKLAEKLKKGDLIVTVSPSWGGAGDDDLLWRYNLGKSRLQTQFGLRVQEMPNTLKGTAYLYNNPKARAEDLMNAFANPAVKGVFSCIGGEESIRLLPYIDFDVIEKNPKVVLGYSDTTVLHLMCFKAGLASFYGPSILAEFAENIEIFPYTAEHFIKAVFSGLPIGAIAKPGLYTGQRIEWLEENKNTQKTMSPYGEFEVLQGKGTVQGHLFGGCMEVLEMAKGTPLWPAYDDLAGAVLFFETSEEMPPPEFFSYWLRNYCTQGILQNAAALVFGKPYRQKYYNEYKTMILKVLSEYSLESLPVFYNMPFGHNQPMCTLPYGALAKLNCDAASFEIISQGTNG